MLACGHEKTPFGEPLCAHIRDGRIRWIKAVKWFTGDDLKTEIICIPCADDRENGLPVDVEPVCDYFHGALYVSPGDAHIVDDGWVWGPFGVPSAWSIDRWLSDNVWESEDGPTKMYLGQRAYYWNHAFTWIDEKHIAVGGIGEDDALMIDGALIFDSTLHVDLNASTSGGVVWASELKAFAGPAGDYFSDGTWLFSSDETGLSRWDLADGAQTGQIPNFRPTRHHRGANELIQLIDGAIVRWKIS